MCDKSRNTWLCVHWQWNTLEWCQLNALQASPVVHLVTPLSCVWLSMNTQPSVPAIMKHTSGVTKCTTGEALSAFSWHHSSVFLCLWTHNQVFLVLSHTLISNAKIRFIYVMFLCFHFTAGNWFCSLHQVDKWNLMKQSVAVGARLLVVAMVATMVAMVAPLWCHRLRFKQSSVTIGVDL